MIRIWNLLPFFCLLVAVSVTSAQARVVGGGFRNYLVGACLGLGLGALFGMGAWLLGRTVMRSGKDPASGPALRAVLMSQLIFVAWTCSSGVVAAIVSKMVLG